MKNYDELLNKSMRKGELEKIIGKKFNTNDITIPNTLGDALVGDYNEYELVIRNQLLTLELQENVYCELMIRYTNEINTFAQLIENNQDEKLFIKIFKVEYFTNFNKAVKYYKNYDELTKEIKL